MGTGYFSSVSPWMTRGKSSLSPFPLAYRELGEKLGRLPSLDAEAARALRHIPAGALVINTLW